MTLIRPQFGSLAIKPNLNPNHQSNTYLYLYPNSNPGEVSISGDRSGKMEVLGNSPTLVALEEKLATKKHPTFFSRWRVIKDIRRSIPQILKEVQQNGGATEQALTWLKQYQEQIQKAVSKGAPFYGGDMEGKEIFGLIEGKLSGNKAFYEP
jgi:hypothetical protein